MKEEKAYRAMFHFLDDRYQRLPSDELGNLLGELSLDIWGDGTPGDPAVVEEWHRALTRAEQDVAPENPSLGIRKAN